MVKVLKSRIFLVLVTAIICISVTVYAANGLTARNVGYSDTTVKEIVDDLYEKYDLNSIEAKKVCQYQSEGSFGAKGTVGAKYKCQLGAEDSDNNGVIYRYFYILAINNDNTVDLIMDRNITQGTSYKTMTWIDAMDFFDNDDIAEGLGTSIKSKWVNVLDVDLPKAQDIVDAVNNLNWKVATSNNTQYFCFGLKDKSSCAAGDWTYATEEGKTAVAPYKWLFNYTQGCTPFGCDSATSLNSSEALGYWTNTAITIQNDTNGKAWVVRGYGMLTACGTTDSRYEGIRPVITLLKSNLYD